MSTAHSKYELVKFYGFTQKAPKGINEIMMVLLNDVNEFKYATLVLCAQA